MAVNYRLLTIFGAVACAVLSAFSLVFTVSAFTLYRAEDFLVASETMDWMNPPGGQATCVETLTDAQLMSLKYDKEDIECKLDDDAGNKLKMRNTLAVSVHGLYYVATNKAAEAYVGDQPNPKFVQADLEDPLAQTVSAVLTATLKDTLPDGSKPAAVSFHNAYRALHWVSDRQIPTNCDTIYPGHTYADIEADVNLMNFIEDIRTGRSVDQGAIGKVTGVKDTWPLGDILIDCNDNDDDPTTPYVPKPGVNTIADAATLTADQTKYLYAHCYAQFLFGSVGSVNNAGAFTVPLPGREPGPLSLPYGKPEGFNATTSYSQRTRLYLGYRYGLSMWAYVPMLLTTCILLGDSLVFFFSEISMPAVINDMSKYSDNRLAHARDSLVIAANTRAARLKRFSICALAVFVSVIFYCVFIGAPWGFFYTTFPRPICEKDDDGFGAEPDHNPNFSFGFWKGTHGGWKSDWDATWYDLAALFLQIVVLLLLPLTTTSIGRDINKSVGGGNANRGREMIAGLQDGLQRVKTGSKFQKYQGLFIYPAALGVLVMVVGQSISNANFGFAWAEGVLAIKKDEYGQIIFDEIRIAELVYDQGVATFAVVVACGLLFAAILGRRLIDGLGCFSGIVFVGWLVLTLVFFLPLLVYASVRAIFNHDEANNDCSVFDRGSFQIHNDLCILRYWTFLVGGGLLFAVVIGLTLLALPQVIKGILATRKKADVVYKSQKPLSKFFRAGPSMQTKEALYDAEDLSAPLGGYQSTEESGSSKFFNFKTNVGTTDSNSLLYAPRMGLPSGR